MEERKRKILMENLKNLLNGKAAPCFLTQDGFEYYKATGARIDPDKLGPVMEFIRTYLRKVESINPSQTSFGLKSLYERCNGNEVEISNGEWIAAMLACGFMCKLAAPFSIEVCFNVFNVSRKREDEITQQIALEKKGNTTERVNY